MGFSFYISRSSVEVLRYFRALELLVFYLDAFLVGSSLILCFDTFFGSLILYQTKGATLGDQKKILLLGCTYFVSDPDLCGLLSLLLDGYATIPGMLLVFWPNISSLAILQTSIYNIHTN